MSIFKDEQHEERTFRQWFAGLFGEKCDSYIGPINKEWLFCVLRMGHPGRHKSGNGKTTWGYGENWLHRKYDRHAT